MARQINRLNPLAVNKLTETGRHADGAGLYLSISKNGGKRWVFLYRWRGRMREMGLGSASTVSLKEARDRASEARASIQRDVDPIAAKQGQQNISSTTFGAYAKRYIEENKSAWRNDKHVRQWSSTIETYCRPILNLEIDAVDTDHVLSILRPIWVTKNETASRVRGRIEKILAAAKVERLREGENPAQWRNHLENVLPKQKKLSRGHHKAMDYADVPEFMITLQQQDGLGALALQVTILTATRTSEVLLAKWDEIEGDCWTIPADRMKAAKPHRVPLTNHVAAMLEKLREHQESEHIFQGQRAGRPMSNMAMAQVLKRMNVSVTVHGFRSSFRDWASECTNHSNETCELALAHTIRNQSEAAYRRGDLYEKRRALMQDWADYALSHTSSDSQPMDFMTKAA